MLRYVYKDIAGISVFKKKDTDVTDLIVDRLDHNKKYEAESTDGADRESYIPDGASFPRVLSWVARLDHNVFLHHAFELEPIEVKLLKPHGLCIRER